MESRKAEVSTAETGPDRDRESSSVVTHSISGQGCMLVSVAPPTRCGKSGGWQCRHGPVIAASLLGPPLKLGHPPASLSCHPPPRPISSASSHFCCSPFLAFAYLPPVVIYSIALPSRAIASILATFTPQTPNFYIPAPEGLVPASRCHDAHGHCPRCAILRCHGGCPGR